MAAVKNYRRGLATPSGTCPRGHHIARRIGEETRSVDAHRGTERDHVRLDNGGGQLTVREEKGAKVRTVRINPKLRDELVEWLNREDWEKVPLPPYLFPVFARSAYRGVPT